MHASSLENMQKCYERFLGRSALLNQSNIRVLDIGGSNVNGSYRDIFSDSKFTYLAVDLENGPGVDLVLEDPYHLPFAAEEFDLVISGQVFEHAEFFWKIFEEMVRVLKEDGFIFLIAPSAGPIHRYPVDCYRFYPDSMTALAKYTGSHLVACWMDDRGPWNDLVGVFSRKTCNIDAQSKRSDLPMNTTMELCAAALQPEGWPVNFEVDTTQGEAHYLDFLTLIHGALQPQRYLEIGVRGGRSFSLAACSSIGVDPKPAPDFTLSPNQKLYQCTSDDFFESHARNAVAEATPDLVFIDGMHLFEFALRDFMNVERFAKPNTLVVIDDIFPNHPLQAARLRQSATWAGDIWRLHRCLQEHRQDLILIPLDVAPTGLLLVAGLNPEDRTFMQYYNLLVRKFSEMPFDACSEEVLGRESAFSPNLPELQQVFEVLRTGGELSRNALVARLQQVL